MIIFPAGLSTPDKCLLDVEERQQYGCVMCPRRKECEERYPKRATSPYQKRMDRVRVPGGNEHETVVALVGNLEQLARDNPDLSVVGPCESQTVAFWVSEVLRRSGVEISR